MKFNVQMKFGDNLFWIDFGIILSTDQNAFCILDQSWYILRSKDIYIYIKAEVKHPIQDSLTNYTSIRKTTKGNLFICN